MRLNFCYLKIILFLHSRDHPKIIGHILKDKQNKKCVYIHEIIRLIIIEMKMKMKTYRINLGTKKNRQRFRHGHEYTKCKKCLSMMMLICIKQHLKLNS